MPRVLRRAAPFLLACATSAPAAAGEWSPPTRVVGLEVNVSAKTLRIRTPPAFQSSPSIPYNPAKCDPFDGDWSLISPDPSTPAAARRQMLEDVYTAFLLGHQVSLFVSNNPATDCMASNRIVTGVSASRTP